MRPIPEIILILFLSLCGKHGWADVSSDGENDSIVFMAGAAYANITPAAEVKNWITGKPYPGIRDSIYARALVMSDGVQKFVILHWELGGAGESAAGRARAERAAAVEVEEEKTPVKGASTRAT